VRRYQDFWISRKEFNSREKVLLYNSRMKLIAEKLKTRWEGQFTIVQAFPYGAVEIHELNSGRTFKFNGHRLKHFQEGRK